MPVFTADLDDYRQFRMCDLNRANAVERVKTELQSQVINESRAAGRSMRKGSEGARPGPDRSLCDLARERCSRGRMQ